MKMVIFLISFPFLLFAQDSSTIVAVGKANNVKEKIFFISPFVEGKLTSSQVKLTEDTYNLLFDDFLFYQRLFSLEKVENKEASAFDQKPSFEKWKDKDVDYIVKIKMMGRPGGVLYKAKLIRIKSMEIKIELSGFVPNLNSREAGHQIAHDLYTNITGKEKSIFKSEIVFVSDEGRPEQHIKELFVMDFDGKNKKALTSHRGVVISPAFSHDRRYVLYSLIKNKISKKRNVNLYVLDRKTKASRLVSSKVGINSGAIFLPDGEHIALTLSHEGNAEIYIMDLRTKKLRRITEHFALDVDPSFNKDGTLMTFLSGRSGAPMIYTMDPRGKERSVKRISFVGQFNATPRFSPDGKQIAFSSWPENRFDIFRIGADGKGLVRLTRDFGSNEDPSFSPDGHFIVFSSQRVISSKKAVNHLYVIDQDGEIIVNLTPGDASCTAPRWSK